MIKDGGVAIVKAEAAEVAGVNSHDQLSVAEAAIRARINADWQRRGVWMQDPVSGLHRSHGRTGRGRPALPRCPSRRSNHRRVRLGDRARRVRGGHHHRVQSRVWYSVLRSVRVGDEVEVGPYASLRPGTDSRKGSKAGTFVEMKNSTVGEGAKVPHLAYIGDATIGARANVGAGAITCNYNGYEKYQTAIGSDAFIGSDTMLVAPVKIGDGAITGAGSVITNDVEPVRWRSSARTRRKSRATLGA